MENLARRILGLMLLLTLAWACGDNQSSKNTKSTPAATEKKSTDTKKTSTSNNQEVDLQAGERSYKKYCLACHQTDGSGVPGLYPPLKNTHWVSGDKERLISIVLNGLQGEIEVNGEIYNNVMPNNAYLSDQEIANVLSYIRANFENNASPITPREVKKIRQQPAKPAQ